ncbi:MAG: hypothetical protein ACRDT6_00090 [Micromonosporaceae bacterium]
MINFADHHIVITRPAEPTERDAVAGLIAEAFLPIPPNRWLLGDSQPPTTRFADYMRIWVDHGLQAGVIEVAEVPDAGLVGATIWWREPAPAPPDYATRLADAVDPADLPRFEAFDAAMHAAHPQHEHLYLGFAAVHPDHQRRGIDTVLLARRHADLDDSRTPAYLVAATPDARRLYSRHGDSDHGVPIDLPAGPRTYPMMRHPADHD